LRATGRVIYSMSVSLDGFVESPSLGSGVVLLRYEVSSRAG
jgi:hypothetical protein